MVHPPLSCFTRPSVSLVVYDGDSGEVWKGSGSSVISCINDGTANEIDGPVGKGPMVRRHGVIGKFTGAFIDGHAEFITATDSVSRPFDYAWTHCYAVGKMFSVEGL